MKNKWSLYAGGGEVNQNIDKSAGLSVGIFSQQTIEVYCK